MACLRRILGVTRRENQKQKHKEANKPVLAEDSRLNVLLRTPDHRLKVSFKKQCYTDTMDTEPEVGQDRNGFQK